MDDITSNRHATIALVAIAFLVLWAVSALLDASQPEEVSPAVEAVEIAQ